MADNKDKIITLSNLTHYDEKIKIWVADQILNFGKGLVFINYAELPDEGDSGKLYITEDAIYKYDSSSEEYVILTGNSGGDMVWKPIE